MKIDYLLFIVIIILNIIGLYFFYSASLPYSTKLTNNPFYYFKKFIFFNLFLPICLFFWGYFLSWNFLKKISKIILLINFIFLILPFIDYFKLPNQNTARWFYFHNFSFQPSEFIKFSMLLFLASVIPLIKKELVYFYISLFIISLVSLIIYFQPSLSNLLIFLASIFGGLMVTDFHLKKILIFILIVALLVVFAFFWGYRVERIKSIFRGDEKGIGFQLKQSRLAIGSGGILGKGLGNSDLKLIGLPLMLTDNIFAIYAEETGFVGSIILIIIFNILIFRILFLGYASKDETKKFFATGVACWLSVQIFIHLVSNLIISTGVPLPFFSYGPSSQTALMLSLGIISKFKT